MISGDFTNKQLDTDGKSPVNNGYPWERTSINDGKKHGILMGCQVAYDDIFGFQKIDQHTSLLPG